MDTAQIEVQLRAVQQVQQVESAEFAERCEQVACQLYIDMPIELDRPALRRRKHLLLSMHRELCEIAAGVAKMAGECDLSSLLVEDDRDPGDLTAEELAAVTGR